jgi:hypothetical protein
MMAKYAPHNSGVVAVVHMPVSPAIAIARADIIQLASTYGTLAILCLPHFPELLQRYSILTLEPVAPDGQPVIGPPLGVRLSPSRHDPVHRGFVLSLC